MKTMLTDPLKSDELSMNTFLTFPPKQPQDDEELSMATMNSLPLKQHAARANAPATDQDQEAYSSKAKEAVRNNADSESETETSPKKSPEEPNPTEQTLAVAQPTAADAGTLAEASTPAEGSWLSDQIDDPLITKGREMTAGFFMNHEWKEAELDQAQVNDTPEWESHLQNLTAPRSARWLKTAPCKQHQ